MIWHALVGYLCSNDMVGKELINQFILVNWAVCSALPPWLPTLPHLGLPVQTCMTTDRGSLVSTECRPTVDNQTIDVYLETKNIYTKKEHFISRINCLHFILYNVFQKILVNPEQILIVYVCKVNKETNIYYKIGMGKIF